jgi:murein DD-endopeptidase MepM/ murein hydrolase activator NlpD
MRWEVNKMAKPWNKMKSQWEPKDSWQYGDEQVDYGWLKRAVVAGFIFAIVYGAHVSETTVGRTVVEGVRYMLSVETDINYLVEKMSTYSLQNFDMSALRKVQTTLSRPADPLLYMTKPVNGKIISPFGWRSHPVLNQEMMHEGIDIEAPVGTSIQASAAGKVKMVTDSAQYGKTLLIENSQEVETLYGHLSEALVKQGETISQGQVIAKTGKTGMTNMPMLYFEIRENGKPIDPLTRIKGDFPSAERK